MGQTLANVEERYRFLVKLGSGGMADVFLGVQHGAKDFKRLIVIKRVHAKWASDERTRQMFIAEAQTVALLNHPHIIKIFDLSRMGDQVCIAMEYVDGESLDYIRQSLHKANTPMPVAVACKLMVEAAEALDYVHSARTREGKPLGLVHRDIGPQNLLLGSNGYLKIIDFGIAKSAIHSDLTSPGMLKGKSSYMAPDVFRHPVVDGRADVYALGLVFYELLTCRRALIFEKDPPVADVIRRVTEEPLASVAEHVAGVDCGPLDALLQRATAKDRDARFATGAEMADGIRAYAESVGGLAPNAEVRAWFQQRFAARIAQRRDLERRAMRKAAQPLDGSARGEHNLNTDQTAVFVRQAMGTERSLHGTVPRRSVNPYVMVAVVFALVVSSGVLFRALFWGESTTADGAAQVGVSGLVDNLIVRSSPPAAQVFVDGRLVGLSSFAGLKLRIEAGRDHLVEVRLEGYEPYAVSVRGDDRGRRRVTAPLQQLPPQKRAIRRPRGRRSAKSAGLRSPTAPAPTRTGAKQVGGKIRGGSAEPAADDDGGGDDEDADGGQEIAFASADPVDNVRAYDDLAEPAAAQPIQDDEVVPVPLPSVAKQDTASVASEEIDESNPLFIDMQEALGNRIVGAEPEYPRDARERGIQSAVVVKIFVDKDGRVDSSEFVTGDRVFRRPVARALRAWRFKPHVVGGRPVATYSLLRFHFRLDD